jgi:Ca-activated chloride channel family protein
MTRHSSIAVVVLAAALAAVPALAQRFRAGIDVVSLSVTVIGPGDRYVTDLEQGEFEVFEDGVLQNLSFFSRLQMPIALAILLDTSASMEEKLLTAQAAASGFVNRLRPGDIAEVIDFDSTVQTLQVFTGDVSELDRAIRDTTAGGSTSLYNALYISIKTLRTVEPPAPDEIRRQAVVVLSDGEDTSSLMSYEDVLDLAKRSETVIYAIGLQSTREQTIRGFQEAHFVLRQLAEETGGRVFFPKAVSELPAIYDQIWEELSSMYSLGYTSANPRRDGQWRRIVVRVTRPALQARTKQGYYASTAR